MEKKKRVLAALLAVAVLFVMLYSALFIAAHVDHDCDGEDCPICYQINICQNTLKNLSFAVSAVALAAAFTYALCRIIPSCTEVARTFTLVSLKVKLTD